MWLFWRKIAPLEKKTTKTDSNKNVRQKKGVAFPVHDNYG